MRIACLLACSLLTACAAPADPGASSLAIADGVEITDTLEVVAIRRISAAGGSLCSGTVIGPYHVLTARHCVAEGDDYEEVAHPSSFEVLVAARLDDPRTIRARHGVARVHPYGGEREEFAYEGRDIAVLVTETRMTTPQRPLAEGDPAEGALLEIVGFGRSTELLLISAGTKRRGETIVDRVLAFDPAPRPLYSGIVIAAGGDNGVCSGDSGGPAFDETGAVVGVTSLGARNCRAGGGGVFMSTHASRAFIEDALAIYPACTVDDPRDGCTATPSTPLGEAISPRGEPGFGLDLAVDPEGGRVLVSDSSTLWTLVEDTGTWSATEVWSWGFEAPVAVVAGDRIAAASGDRIAVWEGGSVLAPDATVDVAGPAARAIAMTGDLIVVGAPYEGTGAGTGVAHVLRRVATEWALETTIPGAHRSFGAAVATDGLRIAVGAPLEDGEREGEGAVHLFARDGGGSWGSEARLVASDGGPHDHFGTALSMRDGVLAVGAPGEDSAGGDSGAVYVFALEETGATELQRLLPIDGSGRLGDFGNLLGTDVELGAGAQRLVAGAPGDQRTGAVYVFGARPAGGYGLIERIGAGEAIEDQRFGERVAADVERVFASAPYRSEADAALLDVVRVRSVTGACGARTMEPSPCEAPIEPDAGAPSLDAGATRDSGPPRTPDAGAAADAGAEMPPATPAGCSCRVPQASTAAPARLALAALAALALVARRRRR